ncbi:MAG: sigma-70 family RNA polymerase sigma factor [Planctomycetaceae bacterium]|nr:sigma-70 family RNA polymerase sigma factor [Planctomycetaceae bacterium]
MTEVTQILQAIEHGDAAAGEQLLPLVYDELRRLATQRMLHEPPGMTLQATALVHEAFLRLVGHDAAAPRWDNRGHFFAAAAEAMRRILVERARRQTRLRHGGDFERHDIDDLPIAAPEIREDLIALDAALTKLATVDRLAADLVQLRYFAGLTMAEAALSLGLAPRTADRTWAYARAWLHREISSNDATDP